MHGAKLTRKLSAVACGDGRAGTANRSVKGAPGKKNTLIATQPTKFCRDYVWFGITCLYLIINNKTLDWRPKTVTKNLTRTGNIRSLIYT